MKSIIFIIIGVLILALLLGIASKNFDNANGEFITDADEDTTDKADEDTSHTETDSDSEHETSNEYKTYDFTVVDGQGLDVTREDSIGRPTVIYFWASWSGHSRYELPVIQEAYEKYKDSVNFMVIAVIDGEYETLESAKEYLSKQSYTFPVYFDVYSEAFNGFELYGFPNIARTYLFYEDGTFAKRSNASTLLSSDMLEEGIGIILN